VAVWVEIMSLRMSGGMSSEREVEERESDKRVEGREQSIGNAYRQEADEGRRRDQALHVARSSRVMTIASAPPDNSDKPRSSLPPKLSLANAINTSSLGKGDTKEVRTSIRFRIDTSFDGLGEAEHGFLGGLLLQSHLPYTWEDRREVSIEVQRNEIKGKERTVSSVGCHPTKLARVRLMIELISYIDGKERNRAVSYPQAERAGSSRNHHDSHQYPSQSSHPSQHHHLHPFQPRQLHHSHSSPQNTSADPASPYPTGSPSSPHSHADPQSPTPPSSSRPSPSHTLLSSDSHRPQGHQSRRRRKDRCWAREGLREGWRRCRIGGVFRSVR
jgi:hypothetical protein